MPSDHVNHEVRLSECARRYATLFEHRARAESRARPRPLRLFVATALRLARQLRELMQRHWDVVVFDLMFGSVKAFGVYPALFALGLAWAIPMAEYAPLNTQLWTAGYLLVRRRIASVWGLRRYGYTLDRLDALRNTILGRKTESNGVAHRVELEGGVFCVTVRRSRWALLFERLRGVVPAPGVISTGELRRLVGDAEFRLQADALRHNPTLYERVLLSRALTTPEGRAALGSRLRAVPAATGLAADLDAGSEATEALLVEQADILSAALGARSMARLGLRWLHGAYRRKIRRERDDIERLEYRLLAAHLDGQGGLVTRLQREHRESRARIASWTERAEAFVARVRTLRSDQPANGRLRRELRIAGKFGLRPRRVEAWVRCFGKAERARRDAGSAFLRGELAR